MHLIVIIALGIFGGFWLCVRYVAWVEGAPGRAALRQFKRNERLREEEVRRAEEAARTAALSPTRGRNCAVAIGGIMGVFLVGVILLLGWQAETGANASPSQTSPVSAPQNRPAAALPAWAGQR